MLPLSGVAASPLCSASWGELIDAGSIEKAKGSMTDRPTNPQRRRVLSY